MHSHHVLPSLAVVAVLACGPAPAPEAPPPPPAPRPPLPAPAVVSPARWLTRHPEALEPTASRKLPGGGTVRAAEHGERWITPDGGAAPGAEGGAPRLSTELLPERIVAIAPTNGRWAFFGVSGRAFLAATPLGVIEEVRPPPAPVRAIAAGSAAVVAVTTGGDLFRSTDGGAHWSPVRAPAAAPAVPSEVAMRADGVGLLQALPQRALVTADDGATWTPITLPAGGPYRTKVADDGEIWLATSGWDAALRYRLDGRPPAFVPQQGGGRVVRSSRDPEAERYDEDSYTQHAAGKRLVVAVGRPTPSDPWKVQVSEWDREGEWKAVPELEGCQGNQVSAAVWDDNLVLGCARDETRPAPDDRASKHRLALYRSKDGGASWTEESGVPLWTPSSQLVAGPEGWVLVTRGCPKEAKECSPHLLRPAAGQPFATLSIPPDADLHSWWLDPPRRRLVALTRGGSPRAARVQVWGLDGKESKSAEVFGADVDFTGDLTVDEQGAIMVVAQAPDRQAATSPDEPAPSVLRTFRSTDGGSTFSSTRLRLGPPGTPAAAPEGRIAGVRLVGDRGVVIEADGQLWETADAARTWVRGSSLPWRGAELRCSPEGCVLGPEFRHGWDLASATSPAPPTARVEPPSKVPGGVPLRCSAGEGKGIPLALVDTLGKLALPPRAGGGLVVPVAGKDLGLDLVLLDQVEGRITSKATPVFPAAPNRATVGSHTDVLLGPAGVLASRSTFPVDSGRASVWISPVTAEVAWWRPKDGKVHRGRLPPLGKGHMHGTFRMGQRSHVRGEVFSLTADAAYYRPDVGGSSPLFTFTDEGAPARITTHAGSFEVVRTASGLTLLEAEPPISDGSWYLHFVAADKTKDPGTTWNVAPNGSDPAILPFPRGADGSALVTWSDDDGPAHGLLVPLKPGDSPAEISDLGLASLLVDRPRACGEGVDPASIRIEVTLPRAARHIMLMEGDSRPALVLVEAAMVVVPPQGQPCVWAWLGHPEGRAASGLVIVPVADLKRSWSVGAQPTEPAQGLRSRNLTVRPLRCEEAPGLTIPPPLEWKGF